MFNFGYACQLLENNKVVSCSSKCMIKTINKGDYIPKLVNKSKNNLNNLKHILEYNLKNKINFF